MIPKTMSFFWSGRMSWMRWLTLWSFRKLNPDWPMTLYTLEGGHSQGQWTTAEGDDSSYNGYDYSQRVKGLGVEVRPWYCPQKGLGAAQASDVFQWWLLGKAGGWYSDMDVLWLRPFTPSHNSVSGSDAVFCLEAGYVAIGLVGACRECPLFLKLYREAVGVCRRRDYQGYGSSLIYRHSGANLAIRKNGPMPGVRALSSLAARYRRLSIAELPDGAIYPYDWRKFPYIFSKRRGVPSTVGMHWFGGSEIVRPFIRTVGPSNWRSMGNTFADCLSFLDYDKDESNDV